jgi:hypothetical protein
VTLVCDDGVGGPGELFDRFCDLRLVVADDAKRWHDRHRGISKLYLELI